MKMNTIGFYSIKIIDLGYIAILYGIIALIVVRVTENIFGEFNEKKENKKSAVRIIGEIMLHLWYVGLVVYLVRHIVRIIPSPVEGLYGFVHRKMRELNSASMFVYIFLHLYSAFTDKLKNFHDHKFNELFSY